MIASHQPHWVTVETENSVYMFDIDVIHHVYSNKKDEAPYLTIYFRDDSHIPIHIMDRRRAVEAYNAIIRAGMVQA